MDCAVLQARLLPAAVCARVIRTLKPILPPSRLPGCLPGCLRATARPLLLPVLRGRPPLPAAAAAAAAVRGAQVAQQIPWGGGRPVGFKV